MTMTPGTQDGTGAGNHDAPYEFGRVHPTTERPLPFTVVQFARLLVLRGKAQERGEGPRRP